MTTDVNGAGGTPNSKDSVKELEIETQVKVSDPTNKDTVAYDTYSNLLGETKKVRDLNKTLTARLDAAEQAELEASGNKDQLIESLKGKVKTLEGSNKELLGNFAFKSLKSQVENEAMRLGCAKPNVMEKLVDFGSLDVDSQTFEANADEVKMAVEKVKTDFPEFFGKPSPKINNLTPSNEIGSGNKKDFSKMTGDELQAEVDRIDAIEGKHKNFVHRQI